MKQPSLATDSPTKRRRTESEHRAIVDTLFDRVYSQGELSLVDDLVTSDFIGDTNDSSGPYLGPAGVKTHVIHVRTVFHGFTIQMEDLNVEHDTFEDPWTAHGTHERQFLGVDPTCHIGQAGDNPHGIRIALPGVTKGSFRRGKIHRCSMVWDTTELHHQLGCSIDDATSDTNSGELAPQGRPFRDREP